ncbi:hypothetical protein XENOCAPTIV_019347 [Xenoophorus captivus]|uniref:Uncharacterized protein n=2 Tax=Goodeidae TaxID=28758 RepID=A0ABV0RCS7_9TELE
MCMAMKKDGFISCTQASYDIQLLCFSHQQAVKKDMAEHPQAADDEVDEMIEELEVYHHGFISSCESPSVSNKTYQEDDFIANLEHKRSHFIIINANEGQ